MMLHRQGLQARSCAVRRPFNQHPARLLAVRAKQGNNEDVSRPRRRNSSASNAPADEPPAVQIANNMAEQQQQQEQDIPPPAVQIANNMAEPKQGRKQGDTPSPAVQIANNMAEQQQLQKPSTPAVQMANNLNTQQQQQQGASPASTASSSSDRRSTTTPADVINEGIRAAASTAEEAVSRGAEAATEGIALGTNLTTQTISAAQGAADAAVRNLASAAEQAVTQGISAGEQILTGAATAVGGAAGAVDGAATAARRNSSSSSRAGNGGSSGAGSAAATGSFDSVNVRVPSNMAWANNPPSRGAIRDVTKTQDFDEDEVEGLKIKILAAVASLDRGLAANIREAAEVDKLCRQLEDATGPITLKYSTSRSSPDASTMDRLAGTWRLIYSSGFNGGSLGGSRPGPPAALVPSILGQVYQVIDQDKMLLDNVVELLLAYGAPQLPFLPRPDPEPTPGVRLTLRHTYEVAQPNSVTIVFESTAAKAIGPDILQGLPTFDVPQLPDFLKPPKNFRSASFDVSYLDASMRITRGDRGELRVYLRDRPLEAQPPADYVD